MNNTQIEQCGSKKDSSSARNYQIDILKILCAVLVLISHVPLGNSDSRYFTSERVSAFGWMSVQIFFAISGFFMVKGTLKNIPSNNVGEFSFNYVTNKFKKIAPQYIIATLIIVLMYIGIYYIDANVTYDKKGIHPFDLVIRTIPELFGVAQSGINIRYNEPVWYISAMLIAMLPLVYLFIKKKDFFIYVFSPLVALLGNGFVYNQGELVMTMHWEWYGFIVGGIVRAVSSLCVGVVAYILYEKLCLMGEHCRTKILITLAEVLISLVFFCAWLINPVSNDTLFSILLLLPVLLAIIFSGKSYISHLFQFNCFRFAQALSLAIYLNHYAAILVVAALYKGKSYFFSMILAVSLTAVFAVVNFLVVRIYKTFWNKFSKKIK